MPRYHDCSCLPYLDKSFIGMSTLIRQTLGRMSSGSKLFSAPVEGLLCPAEDVRGPAIIALPRVGGRTYIVLGECASVSHRMHGF